MSDGRRSEGSDPGRDPIDEAYVRAEAMLADDDARLARRAAVLAAVGQSAAVPARAPPMETSRSERRRRRWALPVWASAACAVGLTLLTVMRTGPWRPASPELVTPTLESAGPPAPIQHRPGQTGADTPESGSGRVARRPAVLNARSTSTPTPYSSRRLEGAACRPRGDRSAFPAERTPDAPAPTTEAGLAAPAPAAPPAPVPPPPPIAPHMTPPPPANIAVPAAPLPPVRAPIPEAQYDLSPSNFGGRAAPLDLSAALRAAAMSGRVEELKTLLNRGAEVDAADQDGDTALMKSIQAGRSSAAALLRQHGASLDRRNAAGVSARDMGERSDPKDAPGAWG